MVARIRIIDDAQKQVVAAGCLTGACWKQRKNAYLANNVVTWTCLMDVRARSTNACIVHI